MKKGKEKNKRKHLEKGKKKITKNIFFFKKRGKKIRIFF